MTIRLSLNRRALIIGLIIIFISALITAIWINKSEQSQADYYSSQLDQINHDIESIDDINKQKFSKDDIEENIRQYQEKLSDIINNCKGLTENYSKTKNKSDLGHTGNLMDQTSRLCGDLDRVSLYAMQMSRDTEKVLLMKNFDASKTDEAIPLRNLLTEVKNSLKKLGENPINDPAVSEQISLIEHLEKLLDEASNHPEKIDTFNRQLKTHQANMFNARTYYWNNTIDIAAANRSVLKLKEQFNQL
jgi:uncharacterized coiled-coil DUF342 family protein